MWIVIKFGSYTSIGPFTNESSALEYKRIHFIEGIVRQLETR